MPRLVPLEVWAQDLLGTNAPTRNTLRRWAREGKIQPAPKRVGRRYFVEATAEYSDEVAKDLRLVKRLIG